MAYYSGSANTMGAVRSALVSACMAEGWSWDSDTEVLSKNTLYVRLQVVAGYLELLGRTSTGGGDAPSVVRMGPIGTTAITWPIEYRFFVFDAEVYCIVRFNVDYHIFCAFGRSTVGALPGTGLWLGASVVAYSSNNLINIAPASGAQASHAYRCAALFWRTNTAGDAVYNDYWVHSDLDAQGWASGQPADRQPVGIGASAPLLALLPNRWNSEAVFLPIRAFKRRGEGKISLTADLVHARYTRVDNYESGDVIELGDERWMVFPFYRKNTAARDGGQQVDHTGTFGWALRYEGA